MFSFTNTPSFLLLLLPLLFLLSPASGAGSPASLSNGTTVYDLLPEYGLPPGILPDTVKSFSLTSSGQFVTKLYGSCYVDFEYLVYYEPGVSGVVKYGAIEELQGVQIRRYLVWFNVDTIRLDPSSSEFIYFQGSWITLKLRIDQFQTVHSCRDSISLLGRAKEVARSILKAINLISDKPRTLHVSHEELVRQGSMKTEEAPPDAAGDGEEAIKWLTGNATGVRFGVWL
ncbi:hypothetical protein BHE74_00059112 [Ensete ventricosum]|nr:hypothetical protein BHE74_00059112 [Ensete ventricosum]